jgi:NAD(P)-dependent dehydrogenase (short-subunit alcohol dehydrogenase family)
MATQLFSTNPSEFATKRVLVTGGTKGMGQAIVQRLTAGGARVATTARSPLPDGQKVELFVHADVATPEGVEKVVGEVLNRLGGVDILVNCVGGSSAPSGGVLALSDARLCSCQGGTDHLQQRPLEGGRAARYSSEHSRARLY